MKRRGFLGALAAFIAAPAVSRVVAAVPVIGPRIVEWADFNAALKSHYAELYEDLMYREHPLMEMLKKKGGHE